MTKHLLLSFLLSGFVLACAGTQREHEDADPYCGMLPETVIRSSIYFGWSSCSLKRLGELALYNGLPSGAKTIAAARQRHRLQKLCFIKWLFAPHPNPSPHFSGGAEQVGRLC